jgi:hypothetical protein
MNNVKPPPYVGWRFFKGGSMLNSFRDKFAVNAFEAVALEVIEVFYKLTVEGVSDCLIGSIKGEGPAFDLLRLGVGCVMEGYSPEIVKTALDAETLIYLNSKELNDEEIAKLSLIKTLIPLIQEGNRAVFSDVVGAFSRTSAVLEALNKKIYPFDKTHPHHEYLYNLHIKTTP